jgi:hypothetical protein
LASRHPASRMLARRSQVLGVGHGQPARRLSVPRYPLGCRTTGVGPAFGDTRAPGGAARMTARPPFLGASRDSLAAPSGAGDQWSGRRVPTGKQGRFCARSHAWQSTRPSWAPADHSYVAEAIARPRARGDEGDRVHRGGYSPKDRANASRQKRRSAERSRRLDLGGWTMSAFQSEMVAICGLSSAREGRISSPMCRCVRCES